jgi:prepilin-type N-terminal cleavage/methylation domain-containing protein
VARDRRIDPADEGGFTLVELLVVILIIGVLASVAIASYTSQRYKAQDAEAKVYANAAVTALDVWEQDHETFAGADQAGLGRIERSLLRARGLVVNGDRNTFEVSVDSVAGGTFTVELLPSGDVVRSCTDPGRGGCPDDGLW